MNRRHFIKILGGAALLAASALHWKREEDLLEPEVVFFEEGFHYEFEWREASKTTQSDPNSYYEIVSVEIRPPEWPSREQLHLTGNAIVKFNHEPPPSI